jgi:hypothetical protein
MSIDRIIGQLEGIASMLVWDNFEANKLLKEVIAFLESENTAPRNVPPRQSKKRFVRRSEGGGKLAQASSEGVLSKPQLSQKRDKTLDQKHGDIAKEPRG